MEYLDILRQWATTYSPLLIKALLVFVIGLWLSSRATKLLAKFFRKKEYDLTLERFILSLVSMTLKVIVGLCVLDILGIAITSFIAVLGAAGLAIGMALSGSLSNFAGGAMILIFKPFRVGEVIDGAGHIGKVYEIGIFNTVLKTPDNKTIIIPNAALATNSLTNYSTEAERRVDLVFGIGYDDDLKLAKRLISDLIEADKRILNGEDRDPFVRLGEMADSSLNITVRAWVKAEDFWDVYFDMLEQVKDAFDANSISIPYPQQDVHLYKHN